MDRKEFLKQVGSGAALLLMPACFTGLAGCKKSETPAANTQVDFTVDVSSGALAQNGGSIIQNSVIVARTNSGGFLAVAVACTHQGTNVEYTASSNNFFCPNHGSRFDSSGNVMQGPATNPLTRYNTTLTGTSLRVFS